MVKYFDGDEEDTPAEETPAAEESSEETAE